MTLGSKIRMLHLGASAGRWNMNKETSPHTDMYWCTQAHTQSHPEACMPGHTRCTCRHAHRHMHRYTPKHTQRCTLRHTDTQVHMQECTHTQLWKALGPLSDHREPVLETKARTDVAYGDQAEHSPHPRGSASVWSLR